jgi:hypothetical protein
MDITLNFHVEASGGRIAWWAESDDLPGVSAAADSLSELRDLLAQLFADLTAERGEEICITSEHLAGDVEEPAELTPRPVDQLNQPEVLLTGSGTPVRRVLVSV